MRKRVLRFLVEARKKAEEEEIEEEVVDFGD